MFKLKVERIMKNCLKLLSAVAALALSIGAHATTVDLFAEFQVVEDNQNGENVYSPGATDNNEPGVPLTNILGGYRDIQTDAISGATQNTGTDCSSGDLCSRLVINSGGSGTLSFSNDTGQPGVDGYATIQYDGDDSGDALNVDGSIKLDTDGLGGENLRTQDGCPAGGCQAFTFEVLAADQTFDFSIGAYVDDTNWIVYDLAANTGAETSIIDFSFFETDFFCGQTDFDTPAGFVNSVTCGDDGVANMSALGALELVLNTSGTVAVDLTIGPITKQGVPEPGILGLIGLSLAALGLVRIRSRKGA